MSRPMRRRWPLRPATPSSSAAARRRPIQAAGSWRACGGRSRPPACLSTACNWSIPPTARPSARFSKWTTSSTSSFPEGARHSSDASAPRRGCRCSSTSRATATSTSIGRPTSPWRSRSRSMRSASGWASATPPNRCSCTATWPNGSFPISPSPSLRIRSRSWAMPPPAGSRLRRAWPATPISRRNISVPRFRWPWSIRSTRRSTTSTATAPGTPMRSCRPTRPRSIGLRPASTRRW